MEKPGKFERVSNAIEISETDVSVGGPHLQEANPGNIIRLGECGGFKFAILQGYYVLFPAAVLLMIVGVNSAFGYYYFFSMNWKFQIGISMGGIGLSFCVIMCTILDPGYVSRPYEPYDPEEDIGAGTPPRKPYCTKCHTFDDESLYHDNFCDLCVEGYDHFCVVLGNIIGKNNIKFFYAIFFFYVANVLSIVFSIVYSISPSSPNTA